MPRFQSLKYILVAALMMQSSPGSAVTRWTLLGPLRIQTCEAALTASKNATWSRQPLNKLRTVLAPKTRGVNPQIYDPEIHFRGSLDSIRPETAAMVYSRILSVLSFQVRDEAGQSGYAIEIRGQKEIDQAVMDLRQNVKTVEQEIGRVGPRVEGWIGYLKNKAFWPWLYIGITALSGWFDFLALQGLFLHTGAFAQVPTWGQLITAGLMTVTLWEMIPKFVDDKDFARLNFHKYDFQTRSLLKVLEQPLKPKDLLAQSWNSTNAPRFAQALLTSLKTGRAISDDDRALAILHHTPQLMPPLIWFHLDHFAYYDETAQEPVWLIIYRYVDHRPDASGGKRLNLQELLEKLNGQTETALDGAR